MKETACCFTGHRAIPAAAEGELERKLDETLRALYVRGVRQFCCGGALGFDMMAERAVLRLREICPDVSLILFLPYPGQDENWHARDRAEYRRILSLADAVSYASEGYTAGCMHARDRQLADAASVCVAYLVRPSGGTFYTVCYARQNGLEIINLA
ncbi:MAG: DUF1273 family protein [Clostridia bacterium]|nr:DUF1273 family protein [Clostridia bacterium]